LVKLSRLLHYIIVFSDSQGYNKQKTIQDMILNKYFSRQIWGSFLGFGLVLGGLSWMVQILLLLKLIIKYGVDTAGFLGMSLYSIPLLTGVIAPFVIFIAVLFVYNKSAENSEISVIFASGRSPWQIARPAVLIGLAVAILHFAGSLWIIPKTQNAFYAKQWDLRYGLGALKLQESRFTSLADGVVVFVDTINQKDLSGLFIRDARNPNEERTISAESGKLIQTADGIGVAMGQGGLQIRTKTGLTTGSFDGAEMALGLDEAKEGGSSRPARMSTRKLLKSYFTETGADSRRRAKLSFEMSQRFLSPLLNLLFALIAALVLLKSSALRRKASIAPMIATGAMVGMEVLFMTIASADLFWWQAGGMLILIAALFWGLKK